jgi:hypothetical protein
LFKVVDFGIVQTQSEAWFKPSEENVSAGICLRVQDDNFRVFPYDNPYLAPFEAAVREVNPLVAVKVRSAAVHAALSRMCGPFTYSSVELELTRKTSNDEATSIMIDVDTRIQVLETMSHLAHADREQCAAFVVRTEVILSHLQPHGVNFPAR